VSAGRLIRAFAVCERPVDVRAAAELDAEEHIDRIVEDRGEVDDLGAEGHDRGAQRRDGGQRRAHDAGVHRGLRHRARLVDGDDELPLDGGASRPKPMTCSGTSVRRSGSQWRRLAWIVRFQSMSPGRRRRRAQVPAERPLTAWCSGRASRVSISATTVATIRRAVARASSGR
jgi:hypothetical protein